MADQSCKIFTYALDCKGGCMSPGSSPDEQSLAVWTHIDYSLPGARDLLLTANLEPYVIDTLIKEESRPQTIAVDDGLLVVLRGINRNAGADPEDMVSIRIWVDSQQLISIRQRHVVAAREIEAALLEGRGPTNIAELLVMITSKLANGISKFVDDLEEQLEQLETEIDLGPTQDVRSKVSIVRRQTAKVRRYLAPQREALESLYRVGARYLNTEQLFHLREQADRIARYIEDLDLVRERSLVAQEDLVNQISQQQNARAYVLSVVAALFLPITFISGVFGMNTAGLPGLEDETAFWWVAGAMTVISVSVLVWLRAKKWF